MPNGTPYDFQKGLVKPASDDMKSSYSKWSLASLRLEHKDDWQFQGEIGYIKFGHQTFLEPDFNWFQSTIIDSRDLIFALVAWVDSGGKITEFDAGDMLLKASKYTNCDWRCSAPPSGYVRIHNPTEYIGYYNFGDWTIMGKCLFEFYQALYDWKEQALEWIQEYAIKLQAKAENILNSIDDCDEALYRMWAKKHGIIIEPFSLLRAWSEDPGESPVGETNQESETGGGFWAGSGPISQKAQDELVQRFTNTDKGVNEGKSIFHHPV